MLPSTRVARDLADRLFQRVLHDADAELLVGIVHHQAFESPTARAATHAAAAGHDALA
jgi:hypothetical protein